MHTANSKSTTGLVLVSSLLVGLLGCPQDNRDVNVNVGGILGGVTGLNGQATDTQPGGNQPPPREATAGEGSAAQGAPPQTPNAGQQVGGAQPGPLGATMPGQPGGAGPGGPVAGGPVLGGPVLGGPAPGGLIAAPLGPFDQAVALLTGKIFVYELTQVTSDSSLYSNNRLSLCRDGQFFLESNVGTTTSLGQDAFLWRRSGTWRLIESPDPTLELFITFDSRRSLVPYTAYRTVIIDASGTVRFDADAGPAQVVGECGAPDQGTAAAQPPAAQAAPAIPPAGAGGDLAELSAALETTLLFTWMPIPDSQLEVVTFILLCRDQRMFFVEYIGDSTTSETVAETTASGGWSLSQSGGNVLLNLVFEQASAGQTPRTVSFRIYADADGEVWLDDLQAEISDGGSYCDG